MKKGLLLFMASCSLLGIADAGYITWEKLLGVIPRCTIAFKCADVLSSQWSSVGPVPLSVFGLLFYWIFLILVSLVFLDQTEVHLKSLRISLPRLTFIWGIIGSLFSLYLVMVMGVILNAWCVYCLISAVNCQFLFLLSAGSLKLHGPEINS